MTTKRFNQAGFTLPEVMLVLLIAAFLVGLPSTASRSYTQKMEERYFLEQLQSSISLIQNETVLSGKRTRMSLYPSNRQIGFSVVNEPSHPVNHTLHFPETVSVTGTARDFHFSRGTGSFTKVETITFQAKGNTVKLVLQMGRGRYDLKIE